MADEMRIPEDQAEAEAEDSEDEEFELHGKKGGGLGGGSTLPIEGPVDS
ncbi:MAG: hypothetical protein ICV64_07480 [Thermoleophilia bacterium]|nr:hypothetical protein [Thermoleophilia bacterium]